MSQNLFHKQLITMFDSQVIAGSVSSTNSFPLEGALGFCAVTQVTIQTPADVVFDVAEYTASRVNMSHSFAKGLKVRLTTAGTLPTGLALETDYFVTDEDAFSFKLASSKSLAMTNTAISFSGGTGDHTVTPQPIGSVKIKLMASIDDTNYAEVVGSTLETASDDNLIIEYDNPLFRNAKFSVEVSSGQVQITTKVMLKGNF